MATMQELLGGQNLTGLTQRTPSGIPMVMPAPFVTPTRRIVGPSFTYFLEEGNAQTASVIHYDAPPIPSDKGGIIQKSATCIHASNYHTYGVGDYQNILQPDGSPMRQLGEWEVSRQTRRLKGRFVNLRYAATQKAFATGALYFDKDGNLLVDSVGAVFSIDYAIPAGHKGQLDVFGTGAIISAKWSASTTKIITQMEGLHEAAAIRTGLPIEYAFYGKNVPGYIFANDYTKQAMVTDLALAKASESNTIPAGYGGVPNWVPVRNAFYRDKTNVVRKIFDDDTIVFSPAPSGLWYDFIEASYLVPRDLSVISSDPTAQLQNIMQVFGMYSYCTLKDKPITVDQIMGDTFLPMINNNFAIYIAAVHW